MKLFHGTSAVVARQAKIEGLKPRGDRDGNWDECPSRSDLVYLTTAYAPYFAFCTKDADEFGIVEVDADLLDETLLLPDEDFMEQATRGQFEGSMEERTMMFRDNLEEFAGFWKRSIDGLGNCAYKGDIPPDAITNVAVFSRDIPPEIGMSVLDPSISIMNYQICGSKYRAITEWFFDRPTPEPKNEIERMLSSVDLSEVEHKGVELLG
jgi:hypothetical protein